jgi:hypothetical protein
MFAVATRDVRCTSSTSDVVSCLASSASRPLEASKLAVGYDRFTSTPAAFFASITAVHGTQVTSIWDLGQRNQLVP